MEVSHEVSQFFAVCDHRVTRVTTFSTRHPNSAWRTLGYSNFAQHVSPHRTDVVDRPRPRIVLRVGICSNPR